MTVSDIYLQTPVVSVKAERLRGAVPPLLLEGKLDTSANLKSVAECKRGQFL